MHTFSKAEFKKEVNDYVKVLSRKLRREIIQNHSNRSKSL